MAVFAFAWAVARARIQSITLDEAGSYFVTVNMRSVEWLWHPAASNHLLNTLMMELFTSVFGPSPLSVRAGALIGTAIYIVVAYWLCRMLSREWIIRLPLFACLVYNPYVFDFFVAARGYGLALAFLLTAIAVAAWSHVRQCQAIGCAFASLCIGLSFTANFSFAFADCALLLTIFLWAAISSPRPDSRRSWFLFVPCAIPALVVVFLIPSSTLLDWRKGELTWGSESMSETIVSMIKATLDQLNPYVVNPFLYRLADGIKPLLIPAFLGGIAAPIGDSVVESAKVARGRMVARRIDYDYRRRCRARAIGALDSVPDIASAAAAGSNRHLFCSAIHGDGRFRCLDFVRVG